MPTHHRPQPPAEARKIVAKHPGFIIDNTPKTQMPHASSVAMSSSGTYFTPAAICFSYGRVDVPEDGFIPILGMGVSNFEEVLDVFSFFLSIGFWHARGIGFGLALGFSLLNAPTSAPEGLGP